jgi:hypothetical protein
MGEFKVTLRSDVFYLKARFRLAVSFGDRLCGLAVRVLDYRSKCPGSIPGSNKFPEK